MRQRRCLELFLGLALTGTATASAAHPANAPHLTGVAPDIGITTPGSRVSVHGSGFSPDAIIYFGGLQAREISFISPSALEVVTPYLRPGHYQLQLKSGGTTVRSEVVFTAMPSLVDSEIDHAVGLAEKGQVSAAIAVLTGIAKSNSDHQVRAFAHYQIGQIYFAQDDLWRWGSEAAGIFAPDSGMTVQTSWRYRLSSDQSDYILNVNPNPDHDLVLADWTVKYDVTQNPEPRFYRGLIRARYDDLSEAKIDSDFILKLEPDNSSYRALAAYIAVLAGDKTPLESFTGETIKDARALSMLGQAAYLSGDVQGAQKWWVLEAKVYPLGASLAYWAGKKHLARGQQRVAAALLTECTVMASNSKEAKEAKELLATLQRP
jgi:tetratricopeptide (TPR) repeat protein